MSQEKRTLSRRTLLKGSLALPVAGALVERSATAMSSSPTATSSSSTATSSSPAAAKPHVAVVGAGAFGGWTAYSLLRQGARVTLLDTWGPGNGRASSGGETRIIRPGYGPYGFFTDSAMRALALWQEHERRWQHPLYHRTGSLYIAERGNPWATASLAIGRDRGLPFEELTVKEARRRFPQVHFEDDEWVITDPLTGYLEARTACRTVLEHFVEEGGEYRRLEVTPAPPEDGMMKSLALSDGSGLVADLYVFACGSWLPRLFPDVLGELVAPSRQEVFFFGTPPGDDRFSDGELPVWADFDSAGFYGIPGNQDRGFKVANHERGRAFEPTAESRESDPQDLARARQFLSRRFPLLAEAPLLGNRVCHYGNTPDASFIVDRHPGAENVWLVGGGSGHGFKHGPALGEDVARCVLGEETPRPEFSLARFAEGAAKGGP